jgi:hypothetical protein
VILAADNTSGGSVFDILLLSSAHNPAGAHVVLLVEYY